MSAKSEEERKKKEKKQQDWFEAYVLSVMEKSIETALKAALNDLFKEWG